MISANSFYRFSFFVLVLGNVLSFSQYKTIFENEQKFWPLLSEHDENVSNLNESTATEYSTATTTLVERNSSTNSITSIQTEFDLSMTTQKTTVYLNEEKRTKKEESDTSNETLLNEHKTTRYPSHSTTEEIRLNENKQNFRSNQKDDISISGSDKNGEKNKSKVELNGMEYSDSTTRPITTVYLQSSSNDGYDSNEDKKTYTQFNETSKHTSHTTETIIQENSINGTKPALAMYRNNFHEWNMTETETSTASSKGAFGEIAQKTSRSPVEDGNDEYNEFNEDGSSAWINNSKTSKDESTAQL
ncbi:uncharacterized protein LOC123314983 isoform X2 [Coccinella septempunctata]|uniref:uncharacterized protein LOC123314983 isoform X2 n=1 Tax=Coccinella septempunctata TaxID=41139 RepID=UPI001D07DA34|nr:uncharacterized protein LOC123314983 isoform X2 [Coccinella septempunctata]